MGRRFAIVIGVAAAGVMTLGAQTAAAATYNTKVTIGQDPPPGINIFGVVYSAVRKCEVGRRVTLFKQQPGADRKLGEVRSDGRTLSAHGFWYIHVPQARAGWHVYARVRREVRRHGLVCRSDRSRIYTVR